MSKAHGDYQALCFLPCDNLPGLYVAAVAAWLCIFLPSVTEKRAPLGWDQVADAVMENFFALRNSLVASAV